MSRIGVFVCHCGINIASTVDVKRVAEEISQHPAVVFATDYRYMCSDPGQQLIREAIEEHELDGVVVAACSPAMHEKTFRRASATAGVNPYRCEMANIREQCSWVHEHEPGRATEKALDILQTMVEQVTMNEALEPFRLPLTKRALIIGGGIAGMQAALDIADAGFPVILVEREDHLGGKMADLSGTYLNFSAAPGLLARKVRQVQDHPHIETLTNARLKQVDGYVGNFEVTIDQLQGRGNPSWLPADVEGRGNPSWLPTDVEGRGNPSWLPADVEGRGNPSWLPADVEGRGNPSWLPTVVEVGAIVIATGWDPYPLERLPEYGGGIAPDVIDCLTFEGMLKDDAEIRRPSDGRIPREVVFVQCAGSREPERGVPYCSKVCCMVVAKQAMMFKEKIPNGQAYVFYIDIRSAGKGYDEYVQRAMEDHDILYLRGKVSKIFQEGNRVKVWGADTLSGAPVEVSADLVVLATPMTPARKSAETAQLLRVGIDQNGFFNEAHPKLRPVESLTAGVFLAGAGQGPKDIPETVSQASGAAAKVLQLFSQDEMTQDPLVACVIEQWCSACGACVDACPYDARSIHPVWRVATVNAALCQNCGACVVACPNKASQIHNWTPRQILAMADVIVS